MVEKKILTSKSLPESLALNFQAVSAVDFFSGQLGINPDTNKLEEGLENQVNRILLNLSEALTELNLGLQKVVKITMLVKDLSKFTQLNGIYQRYFQFNFPVRTTVQVSALPLSAAAEMEFIVDAK